MPDTEKVIKGLEDTAGYFRYLQSVSFLGDLPILGELECHCNDAIALLKEHETVVRCSECENWVPGYITDRDDFIPPKCGKYQQMVGHSADDYCSLGKRQEGR